MKELRLFFFFSMVYKTQTDKTEKAFHALVGTVKCGRVCSG